MFNVGGPEILVIAVLALLVLGPDQLPKAMRTLGHTVAQVKRFSGGFQAELRAAMDQAPDADPTPKPKVEPVAATVDAAEPEPVLEREPGPVHVPEPERQTLP